LPSPQKLASKLRESGYRTTAKNISVFAKLELTAQKKGRMAGRVDCTGMHRIKYRAVCRSTLEWKRCNDGEHTKKCQLVDGI
jgi:hypothetical protein